MQNVNGKQSIVNMEAIINYFNSTPTAVGTVRFDSESASTPCPDIEFDFNAMQLDMEVLDYSHFALFDTTGTTCKRGEEPEWFHYPHIAFSLHDIISVEVKASTAPRLYEMKIILCTGNQYFISIYDTKAPRV